MGDFLITLLVRLCELAILYIICKSLYEISLELKPQPIEPIQTKPKENVCMSFELTNEQVDAFNAWRATKKKTSKIRHYTFCFTGTGIGMSEVIKCSDGTELDITDYDNW